jgi:hypothetical protein|tara:strand:+ start:267 stop:548 length:282 start_codon:yes stop_codon:yes gene_type:complete
MPKKSIPQKLYSSHYTLLGRCVYFLCKLDVTQLKNIVTNLDQLTKIKMQRKRKKSGTKKGGVRKTARRAYEPTAKQKAARRLFAMRSKRGDFR